MSSNVCSVRRSGAAGPRSSLRLYSGEFPSAPARTRAEFAFTVAGAKKVE